jgi:hypothetical protein
MRREEACEFIAKEKTKRQEVLELPRSVLKLASSWSPCPRRSCNLLLRIMASSPMETTLSTYQLIHLIECNSNILPLINSKLQQ